jgi:hypothetical protein
MAAIDTTGAENTRSETTATETTGTEAPQRTQPCARVGCNAPAVASFSFEASTCLVWLDLVSESTPGAGLLCTLHADRLTPPRGWNLQDRRSPTPRLWADRPLTPAPPRAARPERTPRSRPRAAPAALPFAASRDDVDPKAAENATGWPPRPRADIDRVLDARSPLLARAFEGAREAEAAVRRDP